MARDLLPRIDGMAWAEEPRAPEVVREWSLAGATPVRLATSDGWVFVLERSPGRNIVAVDALAGTSAPVPAGAVVSRRPTDLAYTRATTVDPATSLPTVEERLYVASTNDAAEVVVVAVRPGASPIVERTIDLPGAADALAVAAANGLLFVGRRWSAGQAELLVLATDGQILGGVALPGSIEDLEVSGNAVLASSRTSTFVIDASDPMNPALLATTPRVSGPPPPVAVSSLRDVVVDGPMAYLAVKHRGRELQQVNLRSSLGFADANGDGRLRLGCLGDSNTSLDPSRASWCEILGGLVDDPHFEVVNLASPGATAVPSGNAAAAQVALALDPALGLDAAVMAFGTNDTNLLYFSPDPSLFDAQIANIADSVAENASALAEAGLTVYVATAPPRRSTVYGGYGFNERIVAFNAELRRRFAASRIVEFYDGFYSDEAELADGVHLNERGQQKRAWRAFQALIR